MAGWGSCGGLQALLETLGATTRRADADAVASSPVVVHRWSAARGPYGYAQALRSGRTTSCVRSGLLKLRWTRAWAVGELRDATRKQRAGATVTARAEYMAAFVADSSQSGARTALAAVPGPDAGGARTWSRAGRSCPAAGPA